MNAGWGISPWKSSIDFTLKSGGFHPDLTVKSTQNYKSKCFSKNSSVWWMQGGGYDQGFHEIHQISPWNLVDFTFEIQQSSPRFHLWNPPKIIKASVSAKTLQFDECKVGAMTKDFMKSAWNLPDFMWNPPDFMKSAGFQQKLFSFDECKVGAMTKDFMKSAWNPPDFTWNPPDFMKSVEIRRISWNPADFMWNRKTSCKEL